MKNRMFTKVLAAFLSVLLCLGMASFLSFADGGRIQVYDDLYTDTYYEEGVLTFAVDAGRLGEILSNREVSKDALVELIPTAFYDIIRTQSKQSVVDLLVDLVNAGVLTDAELLRLFSEREDVLTRYLDADFWAATDKAQFLIDAGGTRVNRMLRSFFTNVLLGEVGEMKLNGTVIYTGEPVEEFDHNAIQTAFLQALPTVEEIAGMSAGDTLLDFHFTTTGPDVDFDFSVRVELDGDTSKLNSYASKLVGVLTYVVEDSGLIRATVSVGEKATSFYSDILASDSFTTERKLELLGLYTVDAEALVSQLENEDLDELIQMLYAGEIGGAEKAEEFLNAHRAKLEELRSKLVSAVKKSNTYGTFTSLSDWYMGEGTFQTRITEFISMEKIQEKLSSRFASIDNLFLYVSDEDHVVDLDFTFHVNGFYRVRFYDENDQLLYTTFLPEGTDLSLITENATELAGYGTNGWFADRTTATEEMPGRDVDLYDHAHNFETKYDADGHWTECACGQSTAKEDHVYDDDQDTTCNVCGYERTVHTHDFEMKYDEDGHWTECSCGQSTAKEDHVYDDDRDSTCNVCGYVRVPPVTGVADTVFFVVIALTALCGIAVTVVVAKKRKEEN